MESALHQQKEIGIHREGSAACHFSVVFPTKLCILASQSLMSRQGSREPQRKDRMYGVTTIVLVVALAMSPGVGGAGPAFTGTFRGTGRACTGALFVRTKTLEWNTTYSRCQSPYK